MTRQPRIVIPGAPHHVIQRGNRRQPTFFQADDYRSYLCFATEAFREADVEAWAYCLMPNHVHLIVSPRDEDGLAKAVGATHARYTRMINRREGWSGYLWQGRFGSFPMDDGYFSHCVRYVCLNPVRAGLVKQARDWAWSSVQGHLNGASDPLLTPEPVARLVADDPAAFFSEPTDWHADDALRQAVRNGRPLGASDWTKALKVQRPSN